MRRLSCSRDSSASSPTVRPERRPAGPTSKGRMSRVLRPYPHPPAGTFSRGEKDSPDSIPVPQARTLPRRERGRGEGSPGARAGDQVAPSNRSTQGQVCGRALSLGPHVRSRRAACRVCCARTLIRLPAPSPEGRRTHNTAPRCRKPEPLSRRERGRGEGSPGACDINASHATKAHPRQPDTVPPGPGWPPVRRDPSFPSCGTSCPAADCARTLSGAARGNASTGC